MINLIAVDPRNNVTKSELDDNITGLREMLAEIKGYFTQEEKDSFCPTFKKHYENTYKLAVLVAQSKCRSKETMQRKENMLLRVMSELSEFTADYKALSKN